MKRLTVLAAWLGFVATSSAALAGDIRPGEGYSVHLGSIQGTVYYDATGSGDRLVATLSAGPDATPIRMIVSLTDGQQATFSVPRGAGEDALEMTFARHGDTVAAVDSKTVVGSIR